MSVQDRDLQRALELLADDICVTPEEVDLAFVAYVERAGVVQRRRRWQRLVAASAAAVLLVAGATAYWAATDRAKDRLLPAHPTTTQTSVISAHELVGVWAMHADWVAVPGTLWTFYGDGSGGYGNSANTLEVSTQYTLTGARLGMRDHTGCGFSYRLTSYRQGTLNADVRDHCGNYGPGMSWVRLSPASAAGTAIRRPDMNGANPARSIEQVAGVWLMPGTGLLLAIDASQPAHATYTLDDQGNLARSPKDSGTATLTPSGTLTLTSTKTAPACGGGPPRTTLRAVKVLPGKGLQATQGLTATCASELVQATWIMVSTR